AVIPIAIIATIIPALSVPFRISPGPRRGARRPTQPWRSCSRRSARADERRAAVDDEGLPGDVARLFRQQETHGMADIPAEPLDAENRGFAPRLAAGRAHLPRVHARGVDRAGRDAIDPDA